MNKYSPFYWDPKFEPDITKLSEKALEERLIFLGILSNDKKITVETMQELEPYYKKYLEEWKRRRLETNNNNN